MTVLFASQGFGETTIIGRRSCDAWTNEDAQGKASGMRNIARVWLNGFLSGMARGKEREFWHNKDGELLESEAVYHWIDKYCHAYPGKDLADAAAQLFSERTGRK